MEEIPANQNCNDPDRHDSRADDDTPKDVVFCDKDNPEGQLIRHLLAWTSANGFASQVIRDLRVADVSWHEKDGVRIRLRFEPAARPSTADVMSRADGFNDLAPCASIYRQLRVARQQHRPPMGKRERDLWRALQDVTFESLLRQNPNRDSAPYVRCGELRPRQPHRNSDKSKGMRSDGVSRRRRPGTPPEEVPRAESGLGSAEDDDAG